MSRRGVRPASLAGFAALFSGIVLVSAKAQDQRVVINERVDEQRNIQKETEQTARRIGTMLRVLTYHNLDKVAEQKLLQEAATTLSKLSRQQMKSVLDHLEAAANAKTPDASLKEERIAYDRHREVLDNLKKLLIKYDVIRSLDQAAERLERGARDEHEAHLASTNLAADIRAGRVQRGRRVVDDFQEQGDHQKDLNRDLENVFDQISKLDRFLNPEQKERLAKAEAQERGKKILEILNNAQRHLTNAQPEGAAPYQAKASADLLELAQALRTPRERLDALREARARIDKAIEKQEEIRKDTEKGPDERTIREKRQGIDGKAQHAREMANRESRLNFDTKETQALLKDTAKDAAEKLNPASDAMQRAEQELRNNNANLDKPVKNQEQATEALKDARKAVEEMIADLSRAA
jgi:hypothetical protein